VNPAALWLPSQNGLFFDCPQRQSHVCAPRHRSHALPATIVRLPVTWSGPFLSGLIASFPPSAFSPSPQRRGPGNRVQLPG